MAKIAKSKTPKLIEEETKNFAEKLGADKVFLLSMIDDPCKTFITYGFLADDRLMSMLQKIASDVRARAVAAFTALGVSTKISEGCNACKGCEACDKCG
jgi:hypothetical protein